MGQVANTMLLLTGKLQCNIAYCRSGYFQDTLFSLIS